MLTNPVVDDEWTDAIAIVEKATPVAMYAPSSSDIILSNTQSLLDEMDINK